MMHVLRRIVTNWWVVSLLALVAFLLVLVLLLPLVLPTLAPASVRLVIAGLLIAVWIAIAIWRLFSMRRASRQIAESLDAASVQGEDAVLTERMRTALASLRRLGGRDGDYLYSRPWYVIIGPPGAGKTTALENSGLRFLTGENAAAGVGGTRNIQFIFAEEAVLIDTAGRYTSQDSDATRDRGAWQHFLSLLRKHRPLQPINGVIVALGLDTLTQSDLAAIDLHAGIVRQRLRELQSALSLHLPAYVVFTKADLVAGFAEFFDELNVEQRRAVLGATMPWKPGTRANALAWTASFDALWESINDRMASRLQNELDPRRRSLILGFPGQVLALRSRIVSFLSLAFPEDDPLSTVLPRGFYLTSGTQQGTPFDRVIGRIAALYDAPQVRGAHGRAYFINRLLKEVMIGEAGLVRRTSRVQTRDRALLAAGLAAIAFVGALALAAWTDSYVRNRDFQDRLQAAAETAEQQRKQDAIDLSLVGDSDFQQILPYLGELRALPGGFADTRRGGPPILTTFGLYQSGLSDEARYAYLLALQRTLLPRLLWRLEEVLHKGDPLRVYNALKVYLMLGGYAPPSRFDAATIKNWAAVDWEDGFPGTEMSAAREGLSAHLSAMLADPDLGSVWQSPDRRAPLDNALVLSAREQIEATPMADSGYAILKQNAASVGHDWSVGQKLTATSSRAFQDGATFRARSVPFLFTKAGFVDAYETGLHEIDADMHRDEWIYGPDLNRESTFAQLQSLQGAVAEAYAHDYIAAWNAILGAMQPADYFSDPEALAAATAVPSPIKIILQEVARNTRFGTPSGAKSSTSLVPRRLRARFNAVRKFAPRRDHSTDASTIIDSAFADLHQEVGNGSLEKFLQDLNQAVIGDHAASPVAGSPANPASAAELAQTTETLKADAYKVPGVARAFALAASTRGEVARTSAEKSSLVNDYVLLRPQCVGAIEGRYPFYAAGQNAQKDDLNDIFGAEGKLYAFVTTELTSYLDTSGASWRWTNSNPIVRGFVRESAGEWQTVVRIHDLLTKGLEVSIAPVGWGGNARAADFTVGAMILHFDRSNPLARSFAWSLMGMQPGASLVLKSDAGNAATIQGDESVWALFHLFDRSKLENERRSEFDATFSGEGADYVKFHVVLDAPLNPFGRTAQIWSFRCPRQL